MRFVDTLGRVERFQKKQTGTADKGSVQQPEDFSDGSGIHITVAKWLRPSGDWIDKIGIMPDVEVKVDETATDSGQLQDVQLDKAMEMLK